MRKHLIFLAVLSIFLVSCADKSGALIPPLPPGMDGKFDADNVNISYYGRWDFTDSKAPVTDWGATYIKTGFEGTSIFALFDDETNYFEFSIDGGPLVVLNEGSGTLRNLAFGLDDTEHQLLLIRRSHCKYGKTVFKGFQLDIGSQLLPAPAPAGRRVEFIGDSLTIGFENEITTGEKYGDVETENGYMAFGPQAARILGADWHVIGKQAIGVARNLLENPDGTQRKMIDYYAGLLSDGDKPWNFSSWTPDAVVITAGAVDYLGFLFPYPSQQQFEQAYRTLIEFVREKNPGSAIICLAYYTGSAEYTRNAVNYMKQSDSNLFLVDALIPEPWITDASDYIPEGLHLNISGHTKFGIKLAEAIAGIMGW